MINESPVDDASAAFDPPSAGIGVGKAARPVPARRAVSFPVPLPRACDCVCDGVGRRPEPVAGLSPRTVTQGIDAAARRISADDRGHALRLGAATDEVQRLDGPQRLAGASCIVEWVAPLPDRARWVRDVFTDPARRRQGDATALMRSLCAQADALGIALVLEPRPDDETVEARALERWYRSLGFVTLQRDPVLLLARAPA
jgi:GNAT superfamily N-acetyltransferase